MNGRGTGASESRHGSLLSGRSISKDGSLAPLQYSKPYVLFSATDAALAAIDFSKGNVEDGVVDSPPSRGPWRLPVVSASPLQGSPCARGHDRSPSPDRDPSRTPHRQLYKSGSIVVPLHASHKAVVQYASVAHHVHVHDIHPRSTMVEHLHIEDNLGSKYLEEGLQLLPILQTKEPISRAQHPRLEGSMESLCLSPNGHRFVSPRISRPTKSHELPIHRRRMPLQKHMQTNSLGSQLPLHRIKSPCATCNGNSIQTLNHISLLTTSLTCQKKRRENESFVDWFTLRTNSKSLGYTSSRQEDILRALSKRRKVDVRSKNQETK